MDLVNKRPSWYTRDRYVHIKKSSFNVILIELWLRYNALQELIEDEGDECQCELFTDRFLKDEDIPPIDDFNKLGLNVKHLSTPLIKILAGEVFNKCDKENDQLLHEVGMCNLFGDLFLSVNLKLATNDELIREFAIILDDMREKLDKPEPKRFRSKEKFDSIFQNNVLEYMDLVLWSTANGIEIKPREISELITNVNGLPIFTAKEISAKVKRNAEQIFTFEYLTQLQSDVETRKI